MKTLTPDLRFDTVSLEKKLESIAVELEEKEFDRQMLRKRLVDAGFKIRRAEPALKNASFLAADAAFVKKELRHHALWALHAACVYSEFDGEEHPDPLSYGHVGYLNIMYDSYPELGVFQPYKSIEQRAGPLRIMHEYNALVDSSRKVAGPDYFLVDGSIQSNLRKLTEQAQTSPFSEAKKALIAHERLMESGKAVGLVEDSHSSDISSALNFPATNAFLLDIVLEEKEYVCIEKSGINVCYIRLPQKFLNYTPVRKSNPFVARWEFAYSGFEEDLGFFLGLWMREDDVSHPQIYPLRLTDYLTRKVKVGSVLDGLIRETDLPLRYRELREG